MAKKKIASPGDAIIEQIVKAAKELDWTEYRLAKESGVSPMAIGRILRGVDRDKTDPKLSTVVKLARAVGLDVKLTALPDTAP